MSNVRVHMSGLKSLLGVWDQVPASSLTERQTERVSSGVSSYKDSDPIRSEIPLWPHLTLITSSAAPSPNTATLGVRALTCEFWGDVIQSTAVTAPSKASWVSQLPTKVLSAPRLCQWICLCDSIPSVWYGPPQWQSLPLSSLIYFLSFQVLGTLKT